jgi:hypothetical protein
MYLHQKSKHRLNGNHMRNALVVMAVILLIVAAALGIKWLLMPAPFTGYISALDWRYDWQVEEWRAVRRDCWGSGCIPVDGYDGNYEWRDTGRNRQTGQICTDNKLRNTTTRTCMPIYQDVYDDYGTYTINQWLPIRTVTNAGSSNAPAPTYPTVTQLDLYRAYGMVDCPVDLVFVGKDAEGLGCQRAGQKIPRHWYTITITSETTLPTNQQQCEVDFDTFMGLRMEQAVSGTYRHRLRWFMCGTVRLGE